MGSYQLTKERWRRMRWRRQRLQNIAASAAAAAGTTSSTLHTHGDGAESILGYNGNSPVMGADRGRNGRVGAITQIGLEMVHFVCNPSAAGQLAQAMSHQQHRAESRLEALNQIEELLASPDNEKEKEKDTEETDWSLLNSVHLQFISGCFGLVVLNMDSNANTQLYHYQVSELYLECMCL